MLFTSREVFPEADELIPVDFLEFVRYHKTVESLKSLIEAAVKGFVQSHTGVLITCKPSKKAHLATNAFIRADAESIAETLHGDRERCTLFCVPLLDSVTEENGWLLFTFTVAALDAYAKTLPTAPAPDESVFLRRMQIWSRHEDADTPDEKALLQGVFEVLFGAPNAEETLLTAPRSLDGNARVQLEQRLSRIATIILWERRISS